MSPRGTSSMWSLPLASPTTPSLPPSEPLGAADAGARRASLAGERSAREMAFRALRRASAAPGAAPSDPSFLPLPASLKTPTLLAAVWRSAAWSRSPRKRVSMPGGGAFPVRSVSTTCLLPPSAGAGGGGGRRTTRIRDGPALPGALPRGGGGPPGSTSAVARCSPRDRASARRGSVPYGPFFGLGVMVATPDNPCRTKGGAT